MASSLHNLSDYNVHSVPDATGMRVGIVVSEWNEKITGALLDGACKTLVKHGVREESINIKTVPGSFELVYGAARFVSSGLVDVSFEATHHTSITSVKALHKDWPT